MPATSPALHRRRLSVGLLMTLALFSSACGSSDSSDTTSLAVDSESSASASESASSSTASEEAVPATRIVETSLGPVEIPESAEVIIALDEYAALNLLAVGVAPTAVFGTYQSPMGEVVLDDMGIELIPGTFGSYNYEAIAAFGPDLIVMTAEGATNDFIEPISAIAPTVVIPYDAPWREILSFAGEITAHEDNAVTATASIEALFKEYAADLDGGHPSIGLLGNTPGFGIFSMSEIAPISSVLTELGYTRPEAEQGPSEMGSAIMTSEELLLEHDADLLFVLSGAYYDSQSLTGLDLYQAIPAVADGRSFVVDADGWLGSFPFAVYWVLEDLRAVQNGEGQDGVGTVADTSERWTAFQSIG